MGLGPWKGRVKEKVEEDGGIKGKWVGLEASFLKGETCADCRPKHGQRFHNLCNGQTISVILLCTRNAFIYRALVFVVICV